MSSNLLSNELRGWTASSLGSGGSLTGAASVHVAVADTVDTSYVSLGSGLNMTTVTGSQTAIPANNYVVSIAVKVRARLSSAGSAPLQINAWDGAQAVGNASVVTVDSTAWKNYTTTVWTGYVRTSLGNFPSTAQKPTVPFANANIASFVVGLLATNSNASNIDVSQVALVVIIGAVNLPTVYSSFDSDFYRSLNTYQVFRNPSDFANSGGSPPLVMWPRDKIHVRANFVGLLGPQFPTVGPLTYSGNTGSTVLSQVPDVYQLKIYNVATVRAASFSADTTVPDLYDSGPSPVVVGTTGAIFISCPADLSGANGNWVAFLRFGDAAKHGLFQYYWGAWLGSNADDSIARILGTSSSAPNYGPLFKPPVKPKLTATLELGNNRTKLDIQGFDNLVADRASGTFVCTTTPGNQLAYLPSSGGTLLQVQSTAASANTNWGGCLMQLTKTLAIGDYVLTYPSKGYPSGPNTAVEAMPVVANQLYAAGAWVATAVTGRTVNLKVIFYSAAGAVLSTTTVATATDSTTYQYLSGTVTSPAGAVSAQLQLQVVGCAINEVHYTNGWVLRPHDATYVPALVTDTCMPGYHGGNWIAFNNDGSETSWLAESRGYSASFGVTISLNDSGNGRLSGGRAFKATRVGNSNVGTVRVYTADGFAVYSMASSFLPKLPMSIPLTVSAWVKSATTPLDGAAIGLEFYDKDNVLLSSAMGSPLANTTTTYQKVTCSVAATPARAAYYKVVCSIGKGAAGEIYYWDDFALYPDASLSIYMESAACTDSASLNQRNVSEVNAPGSFYIIERQIGSGAWNAVKIGQLSFYGQTATVYDNLVPYGTTINYRAYVYGQVDGEYVKSAASTTQSVTQAAESTNRWMLWDPELTTGPLRFDMNASNDFGVLRDHDVSVFKPLGRPNSIVVSDQLRGREFSLQPVDSMSSAELDTLATWVANGRQLWLVRQWTGEWWSVRLRGPLRWTEQNTQPVRYLIEVEAEEIDVPQVI